MRSDYQSNFKVKSLLNYRSRNLHTRPTNFRNLIFLYIPVLEKGDGALIYEVVAHDIFPSEVL